MPKYFSRLAWVPAVLLVAAVLFAGPARADVNLRVEARPISDPIEAFVTVTAANGDPIGGLTIGDFTVKLDQVTIASPGFSLPPAEDPSQRVSVVFVMDYSFSVQSVALTAMQDAVEDFINTMSVGDFAAIIKFNDSNPDKASVVQSFTQIDGGTGTSMLISAVMAPYPGDGSNILDAVDLAVDQFIAPPSPLPAGPHVIILVTDGGENSSNSTQSTVVANANGIGIPVFTIGVGDVSAASSLQLLTALAAETGGNYLPAPDDAAIAAAYVTISELLDNEYLLTISATAIVDCGLHTLQVKVVGQATPTSVTFTRCDTTPDPFTFTNQTGVEPSAVVTSNAVTISDIDGPAVISVSAGEYSIGCGAAFTTGNGTISNGQTVCVRHTASSAFSTASAPTILSVGGVSGTFTSTTRAAPPPPVVSGGGGAMGVIELLLGLAVLVARRRRSVHSSHMRIT